MHILESKHYLFITTLLGKGALLSFLFSICHLKVPKYTRENTAIECHAQVVNQVVRLPGLYDYVVYVSLNGSPDVIPENVLHTSLVCSARILETEQHRYVAVHPEGSDE
jgi:hypothetical protein